MPASAFSHNEGPMGELTRHNSLEDQRALQVALELSLLSFGGQHEQGDCSPTQYHHTMDQLASSLHYADEMRFLAKKSQNMTECVPVPSSEHVAEIVGRQGCKIKALRAKTNTYIKTPVRGEEPVFVVTGRKEDVGAAKREILSAAEHFSQIRASRRSGMMSQCGLAGATGLVPPPPVPGQVTIQVRVPYRVVGLVVGPKGATIKRIQQQTSTYIVTPSREKEPIFEVTGMPDNVDQARREIEAHIALRTGLVSGMDGVGDLSPDMMNELTAGLNGLGLGMLGGMDGGHNELMNSLYNVKTQNSMRTAFSNGHHINNDPYGTASSGLSDLLGSQNQFGLRSSVNGNNHPFGSAIGHKMDNELQTLGSGLLNSLYDSDEGISLGGSDSPTLSHSLIQPNIWSTDFGLGGSATGSGTSSTSSNSGVTAKRSNSFGFPSATTAQGAQDGQEPHPPARRISSDPLSAIGSTLSSLSAAFQIRGSVATTSTTDSDSGVRGGDDGSSASASSGSASPTAADDSPGSSGSSTRGSLRRECIMCCEGEMVAALVPCGHKLFCMTCAQGLVPSDCLEGEKSNSGGECPVCHQAVTQAIRIFS